VYVVLAIVFVGIVLGVGPYVSSEGRRLVAALPGWLSKFGSGQIVQNIGSKRGWSYETQMHVEHFVSQYRDAILNGVKRLGLEIGVLATGTFWFVLIPILAIPFLKDGRKMVEFGYSLLRLRPRTRHFTEAVLRDLHSMAANYIRAQLALMGLALVAYTVVLSLMRVDYAVILGVAAGILEFIPMIGPLIGAILILAVGFLTGFHHLILLLVFLGGWRLLQDYVNSPRLMHRTLRLHPFAVIFAVLAGGEIAGFLGVFLSIPLLAAVHIIWQRWHTYGMHLEDEPPSHARAA
jgi:predicted PurR-regulated permease PerM